MFASFMSTAFRLVAFASKAEMINVLREKAVVAKHRGADAGDKDSEKPTESEKPAESENAEQAEKSDGELQEMLVFLGQFLMTPKRMSTRSE